MLRALLAATALSLAIPAAAETLPIAGSDPAAANVNDLLRIAVERFEGADGAAVAQHLEAALGEARFDGRSYYRIVAPESGAPIDGLVTGTTRASVDEVPVTEKRKKCTEYDPADKKKCVTEVEVDIRCRRRTITVATTARLVAIKDGSIRYTRPLSARDQQTWCPDRAASRTAVGRASAIIQQRRWCSPARSVKRTTRRSCRCFAATSKAVRARTTCSTPTIVR